MHALFNYCNQFCTLTLTFRAGGDSRAVQCRQPTLSYSATRVPFDEPLPLSTLGQPIALQQRTGRCAKPLRTSYRCKLAGLHGLQPISQGSKDSLRRRRSGALTMPHPDLHHLPPLISQSDTVVGRRIPGPKQAQAPVKSSGEAAGNVGTEATAVAAAMNGNVASTADTIAATSSQPDVADSNWPGTGAKDTSCSATSVATASKAAQAHAPHGAAGAPVLGTQQKASSAARRVPPVIVGAAVCALLVGAAQTCVPQLGLLPAAATPALVGAAYAATKAITEWRYGAGSAVDVPTGADAVQPGLAPPAPGGGWQRALQPVLLFALVGTIMVGFQCQFGAVSPVPPPLRMAAFA